MTLTHVSHLLRILPQKQRNPCAFSASLVLIPAGFVAVSAAPNVCQMSQARYCSKEHQTVVWRYWGVIRLVHNQIIGTLQFQTTNSFF